MISTKLNKKEKLIMDVTNNHLYLKGKSVLLTEKEKRLLQILMMNQGGIVGHTEIRSAVWPERPTVIVANNILQLIYRLRTKLKSLGVNNGIVTIAGKGYKLDILIFFKSDKHSFKSWKITQPYNIGYCIIMLFVLTVSIISIIFFTRSL